MAPQMGGASPQLNPELFFQIYGPRQIGETLCTVFKLDMYNYADKLKLLKKLRGISEILDVFMTPSMSDLCVILQCLATSSVMKCVETLDFCIVYVFW